MQSTKQTGGDRNRNLNPQTETPPYIEKTDNGESKPSSRQGHWFVNVLTQIFVYKYFFGNAETSPTKMVVVCCSWHIKSFCWPTKPNQNKHQKISQTMLFTRGDTMTVIPNKLWNG